MIGNEKAQAELGTLINGTQQNGMRGGTYPVEVIAMLNYILKNDFSKNDFSNKNSKVNYFLDALDNEGIKYVVNGKGVGIVNLDFGVNNHFIQNYLLDNGIYVSTGSACNGSEESYVLKAIGKKNGIRMYLGHTTQEEINFVVKALTQIL